MSIKKVFRNIFVKNHLRIGIGTNDFHNLILCTAGLENVVIISKNRN